MRERIADGPRTADDLLDLLLAAEPSQAAGVVRRERLVVPANRPSDRNMAGINPAGGVVRGRDATRQPVAEPVLFLQPHGNRSCAGPRLAFKLHQVKLRYAALRPEVRRQPNLGQRLAIQIKGEAFDRPGAEVPARD